MDEKVQILISWLYQKPADLATLLANENSIMVGKNHAHSALINLITAVHCIYFFFQMMGHVTTPPLCKCNGF